MSTETQAPTVFPDEPLDLSGFVPYFLSSISNRWTSMSSQVCKKLFGIGVVEWRILGYLGSPTSGGVAAALDIALDLGLDQALVSRAKQNLMDLGYVEYHRAPRVPRLKPLALTPRGLDLFCRMRDVALRREKILLAGLDAAEKAALLVALKHIHSRLPDLVTADRLLLSETADE